MDIFKGTDMQYVKRINSKTTMATSIHRIQKRNTSRFKKMQEQAIEIWKWLYFYGFMAEPRSEPLSTNGKNWGA